MKNTKTASKTSKKTVAKKTLTAAQRSAIARAAAYKAHQHPTFMKIHARAAKKAAVPLKQYLREMIAARKAA